MTTVNMPAAAPVPAPAAAAAQTLLQRLLSFPPETAAADAQAGIPAAVTAVSVLEAAAGRGRAAGCAVLPLGVQVGGDVRQNANLHAAIAMQSLRHGRVSIPTLLLSGGSLLRAGQATGPADFILEFAAAMDEHRAVYAYALGVDPLTRAPIGVFLAPDTLARARAQNLAPAAALTAGAAQAFFSVLGNVIALPATVAGDVVVRAVLITPD